MGCLEARSGSRFVCFGRFCNLLFLLSSSSDTPLNATERLATLFTSLLHSSIINHDSLCLHIDTRYHFDIRPLQASREDLKYSI